MVRARQEQLEADLERAWSGDPLVLSKDEVHERDTENDVPVTNLVPTRNDGARGGGRTHMPREGQQILSLPRMPFRHPGHV